MKKGDNHFYQAILNLDGTENDFTLYYVHFYDDEIPTIVRASNTTTAEILAMASRILDKKSFGVRKVVNSVTGNYVPSVMQS